MYIHICGRSKPATHICSMLLIGVVQPRPSRMANGGGRRTPSCPSPTATRSRPAGFRTRFSEIINHQPASEREGEREKESDRWVADGELAWRLIYYAIRNAGGGVFGSINILFMWMRVFRQKVNCAIPNAQFFKTKHLRATCGRTMGERPSAGKRSSGWVGGWFNDKLTCGLDTLCVH